MKNFQTPARRPKFGLARVLSKIGYCSRAQAWQLILEKRVRVNGAICPDPERPVDLAQDEIQVDGRVVRRESKVYLMLNKPRGLVTTRSDEQGRETVYRCLKGQDLPWLAPVGRLDKASEGLLLMTNDTLWADGLMDPGRSVEKTYHAQIDRIADASLCERILRGVTSSEGDFLTARRVAPLRTGTRNSWLEIVIDEGKNRHIRRLLEACEVRVLRLVRVAIGPLMLGSLAKGQFRHLNAEEVRRLSVTGAPG